MRSHTLDRSRASICSASAIPDTPLKGSADCCFPRYCYVKYNSIHHSFQRAVAVHSTDYTLTKGNVAFDIVGHMFFVERGAEWVHMSCIRCHIGCGIVVILLLRLILKETSIFKQLARSQQFLTQPESLLVA